MIDRGKILAIIPARGGSKRLPKKNILDLAGKPMIAWTIESALGSEYIDRIVVSTDDIEIAEVSKKYGIKDAFMRPEELSSDTASSVEVVEHVVDVLYKQGEYYDYILLLQPTSPLRDSYHIDKAIELLKTKQSKGVVSFCRISHPVEWAYFIKSDLIINHSDNKKESKNQNFPERYIPNGAIYIVNMSDFLKERSFFLSSLCHAYIMDQESSVDIDNMIDYKFANFLKLEFIKNEIQKNSG